MKTITRLLWAASTSAFVGAMATKRFQCPKDEFWDLGTDRCEPCSSICENAVQTGFGDFCREMCPGKNSYIINNVTNLEPQKIGRKKNELRFK